MVWLLNDWVISKFPVFNSAPVLLSVTLRLSSETTMLTICSKSFYCDRCSFVQISDWFNIVSNSFFIYRQSHDQYCINFVFHWTIHSVNNPMKMQLFMEKHASHKRHQMIDNIIKLVHQCQDICLSIYHNELLLPWINIRKSSKTVSYAYFVVYMSPAC